jgi:hypothetical protein
MRSEGFKRQSSGVGVPFVVSSDNPDLSSVGQAYLGCPSYVTGRMEAYFYLADALPLPPSESLYGRSPRTSMKE